MSASGASLRYLLATSLAVVAIAGAGFAETNPFRGGESQKELPNLDSLLCDQEAPSVSGFGFINGDFEQDLSVGWTVDGISAGFGGAERVVNGDGDDDYELHIWRVLTGSTVRAFQVASIQDLNQTVSFRAKLVSSDNWLYGQGYALAFVVYKDASGATLGYTLYYQSPMGCSNSPTVHCVQVTDNDWHTYSLNIADELKTHLPGVDPSSVAGIRVQFTVYGNEGLDTHADVYADDVLPSRVPVCVPDLISPEEGAVLHNACTNDLRLVWDFDWSDCAEADAYHLYVKNRAAVDPLIDEDALTASFYHFDQDSSFINGDSNRFNWYWKVRAKVGGVWGAWSAERNFEVDTINTRCQDLSIGDLYFASISKDWVDTPDLAHCPRTDQEFVGAAVKNEGTLPLFNIRVRFQIDEGSPVDSFIPVLEPDSVAVVEFVWDLSPVEIDRDVSVGVDPLNEISERDETNNVISETVSITFSEQRGSDTYYLCEDAYGTFYSWSCDPEVFREKFETVIRSWPGWSWSDKCILELLYSQWAQDAQCGGHCYGMASTACLYFESPVLKPHPEPVFEFPKDTPVVENIEKYQQLQLFDMLKVGLLRSYLSGRVRTREWFEEQRDYLTNLIRDRGLTPMLVLWDYNTKISHAVQAYKIVEFGNRVVISIYDPNLWLELPPGPHSRVIVMDLDEKSINIVREKPDYARFLQSPESFEPCGFPYLDVGDSADNIMATYPIKALDDSAKEILHTLYDWFMRGLVHARQAYVSFSSPVHGLITDSQGNRIGFIGDTFVNEIPGADFEPALGTESYLLPAHETYTVKSTGLAAGIMSLSAVMPVAGRPGTCRSLQWRDVAIEESTVTFVSISDTTLSCGLRVDVDHDGSPDTVVAPAYNAVDSWLKFRDVQVGDPLESPHPSKRIGDTENNPRHNLSIDGMTVQYYLPEDAHITLNVYDVQGRLVRTFIDRFQQSGFHSVRWDGRDRSGVPVSTGLYFCILRTPYFTAKGKIVMLE